MLLIQSIVPGNFYPRPPRGGRRYGPCGHRSSRVISIHALREEGDLKSMKNKQYFKLISIHALREEGDIALDASILPILNFYPRPPRGGRPGVVNGIQVAARISIHALREEGDKDKRVFTNTAKISIHALREEGDAA